MNNVDLLAIMVPFAILTTGLIIAASVGSVGKKLEQRILVLEYKVDSVAQHVGVSLMDVMVTQICQLLNTGQRVQAVRLYRRATGVSLRAAARAVEQIEQDQTRRTSS